MSVPKLYEVARTEDEEYIFYVNALESEDDSFTDWEVDFYNSITQQDYYWTTAQKETIKKMWKKYCDA